MQLLSTEAFAGLSVVHGFTTRAGGVSRGSWGSLNLARRPGEADSDLQENWHRVASAAGLSAADVAIVSQVHGATVLEVGAASGPLETLGEADGMWTSAPGILLAVRIADCVPVLFASERGVAVAHAGWRGIAAGVVGATVRALCAGIGGEPKDLCAAVGPHISGAAYEVGSEVVDGLAASGVDPEVFVRPGRRGRPHVDLGAAVDAQLRSSGVSRVEHLGGCTYSDGRFHSFRRDGVAAGRMAGVVARIR